MCQSVNQVTALHVHQLPLEGAMMEHIYQLHQRSLAAEADKLCVYEYSGIEWFHLPHGTCFLG